jgi:hypothetical protein
LDSLITAASRALAAGDPLGALKRVALRDDPPALALRGIAMAQLGDLVRAKALLRRATRAFGTREAVAQARCIVAEAEVALAARDLRWPTKALDAARVTLERNGDAVNAAQARYLEVRRHLLTGSLDSAGELLSALEPSALPQAQQAVHDLLVAGVAIRRLQTAPARAALARAERAAQQSGIPALTAEVESARRVLEEPAARLIRSGAESFLRLDQVERLFDSTALVVDACRHVVRNGGMQVPLGRRPVLFALARALGNAWPAEASRAVLIQNTFRIRRPDETHRARLRVEIGRLRAELEGLADIRATSRGFELVPAKSCEVVVLARPVDEEHAAVLALLADGEAWATSALALALGASQRSVQRALSALAESGKAESYGRGRARRWIATPVPGITTTLLLPAALPGD